MKKELSPRQKEIFDFISHFVSENGYSPSINEIGDDLLISNSTANTHLKIMKIKGWITSQENTPRSFRIVQQII
jgi:repressor LexA